MPGTDVAHGLVLTERIALYLVTVPQSSVRVGRGNPASERMALPSYAMSGTELAYGTSLLRDGRY
eukprot:829023-Rhodomonas_salina.3